MKRIKIKMVDFVGDPGEGFFLIPLLRKYYEVEFSDSPDFIIYSVWGKEHLKYNCTKIFWTEEPVSPNFEECDYAIGFDFISFEDRYLRIPLFEMNMDYDLLQNRERFAEADLEKRKFCNFIYSNSKYGKGAFLRQDFCKKLMEYKWVDCPGMVLHNVDMSEWEDRYSSNWFQGKIDFISNYKFTIAFENSMMNGYTTEKLLQPLLAGSIPIYYGNPRVVEEFNPEAFINCNDYDNDWDAVIERVKEIDCNPVLAHKMIMTPSMRETYMPDWQERLERFLINIMEKGSISYNEDKLLRLGDSKADTSRVKGTLNELSYGQGILATFKKYSQIAIYGDGWFGKQMGELLLNSSDMKPTNYIVSRETAKSEEMLGIKKICINEIHPEGDMLVIVAVKEEAQADLVKDLLNRGFDNLFTVNNFVLKILKSIV